LALLRSWVQIPPGPFLSVVQIRYCSEIDFNNCRTNSAAMPMPYPTVCPTFCPTKVEIFTKSVGYCPPCPPLAMSIFLCLYNKNHNILSTSPPPSPLPLSLFPLPLLLLFSNLIFHAAYLL
jgi:hypothetical protein